MLSIALVCPFFIGRAGASPPSRATVKFIFLTDRVYTYRIVLNVSTRFYFSVYATTSLVPRACVRLLPTPEHHAFYLGHRQLRQCQFYNPRFFVLERNQLLLRFVSTCDNHAVFFYGEPCTQLAAVPFCIAVCIPVRVGLLNVLCYASLGPLYLHYVYIIYTKPAVLTVWVAPARPKMLSIALVYLLVYNIKLLSITVLEQPYPL